MSHKKTFQINKSNFSKFLEKPTAEIKFDRHTLTWSFDLNCNSKEIIFTLEKCPNFIDSCDVTFKIGCILDESGKSSRSWIVEECHRTNVKKGESHKLTIPMSDNEFSKTQNFQFLIDVRYIHPNPECNQTLFFCCTHTYTHTTSTKKKIRSNLQNLVNVWFFFSFSIHPNTYNTVIKTFFENTTKIAVFFILESLCRNDYKKGYSMDLLKIISKYIGPVRIC